MMRRFLLVCGVLAAFSAAFSAVAEAGKLKVLIVDGQNNHKVWPKSTMMMKQYLEESGLFEVDLARSKFTWRGSDEQRFLDLAGIEGTKDVKQPMSDPDFSPDFKAYDVVVNNFGFKAAPWPESTMKAFEEYMAGGGGLVVVHAADNAFEKWPAYNEMIGLGGWGGRSEKDGPYVFYSNEGELVRDMSKGPAGTHASRFEIPVTVRVKDHPITRGMPEMWLTTEDELYSKLRGPAEHMTILATGKDARPNAKTDRHEPVLMVIDYGKGRVFHNTLGHDTKSNECVGFIVCLLRGCEWAATGEVTQSIPADFPSAEKSSGRTFSVK